MRAVILQIHEGSTIFICIMDFSIINQMGVTMTIAFRSVRAVMLSQPMLSLPGTFHMLVVLSLHYGFRHVVFAGGSSIGDFAIALAGDQGQVFEGTVAGKLVAAGDVLVVLTTTFDPSRVYLLWPDGAIEDEEEFERVLDEEEEFAYIPGYYA